ncbi:hypothetical protein ROBYS_45440 [Roseobacter sp. OBYS 0001]|nr:hypothetical protein ROBYS_45440 [Roseobacter sp. OBYS 0001]
MGDPQCEDLGVDLQKEPIRSIAKIVKMNRDLIVAQRHHTVGRRFEIRSNSIGGPIQLQSDLMV